MRGRGLQKKKRAKLTNDITTQIIQVPADGFRNGDMGDDQSAHSAQEGLPVYILPRNLPTYPSSPAQAPPSANNNSQKRTPSFHHTLPPLPSLIPQLTIHLHRNEKHLAPPRPLLHVPPLLLHAPHRHSLGNSVHELRRRNRTTDPPLRVRALPVRVAARSDSGVFPRR